MSRPAKVYIDSVALRHNLAQVKSHAPLKKIIAMVKANAYGCGLAPVLTALDGEVDAFGVACLEEAVELRALGSRSECVLFEGVFDADELLQVAGLHLQCVVHQQRQLSWILNTPLPSPIKLWLKVDTGMHRLGFDLNQVTEVLSTLRACPWVDDEIILMSHLACADEPLHAHNLLQLQRFYSLESQDHTIKRSLANSAAILALPDAHVDIVRPGIMLYGVSPFANQNANDLNLMPVMHLSSAISAIHRYPAYAAIGYGGTWCSDKASVIGVVAIGYGDGYPRHISSGTPTWVNGCVAPIVGRVSMDMLTIDLSNCIGAREGDAVELWGRNISIETIAKSAGTIAYELLCQVSARVR